MQRAEFIRVLLFLVIVGTIYALAALYAVRFLLHKFKRSTWALTRKQRWLRNGVFALAVAGLLCFAYGYFIEPYWVEITYQQIPTAKLAAGSRKIRLVHISDLHSDPKARLEPKLPDLIAKESPDLILFTGDALNSTEGLLVFRDCMTKLAAIAPTFAVRGNWDIAFWGRLNLFEGTGVKELNREAIPLTIETLTLWLVGAGAGDERGLQQAIQAVPDNALTVVLYHYPDLIQELAAQNVDLYCAGHTHGGQIALPFYGALITLSKYGKQYEAGLYREKDTRMYVNRGIGMEGGHAPRVRFCSRPEITVIDLIPDQ